MVVVKAAAPVWEEYRPVEGSLAPRARTGHVCVTYNDKVFVYVLPFDNSWHELMQYSLALEARTANSIIMILGLSTLLLVDGQS